MQTPKNAFDLFPADQFDAWVDGVRSKIIDGLEHQHLSGGSRVKVPELSSKALEAIEIARREEELTRQAIASSSSLSNQMEAGEQMDMTIEVTQEVTTTTTFTEYEEAQPEVEQGEGELGYPAEAAGSEVGYEDEAGEAGYEAESPSAVPVDEPFNESYDDDAEVGSELGDDPEAQYDEDDAEGDRSQEQQSEDGEDEDGSEEDFEILGSDQDIGDQERDELSSNEDDDEASMSQERSEEEDDVEDEDDQLGSDIDMEQQPERQVEEVTTSNQFAALAGAPEQPIEADPLQPDEDAESGDERDVPDTDQPMNAVRDVPGDEEADQDGEMAGPGSDAEDEVFSVQDSSDEEAGSDEDGASQSATGEAGDESIHSGEDDDEEEEEMGEGDALSQDGHVRDRSQVDETGSTADREDAQSHHSDQEDRAQREGLATDIRQPDLPPTTESDGIYRGTFEIDGTAQEGIRIDEKHAIEEDDKDSQQDPEYSADERESVEDIQYADDDNAGTFAQTDRSHHSRDHIPTAEEVYADQIQLEPQTKEEIEDEIRHHDNREILDDTVVYPDHGEEYNLDGEDGSHHVEGAPVGHEDDEVVDETDPKDMEMAARSNELPAVLQPLPTEERQSRAETPEPAPLVDPESLVPQVREEPIDSTEAISPEPEHAPTASEDEIEQPVADASITVDSGESTGGNETDNEDNDMQDVATAKIASNPEELDELEGSSMPSSRAMSPQAGIAQAMSSSSSSVNPIAPSNFQNDVVPGEWKEGMALRFSQTKASEEEDSPMNDSLPVEAATAPEQGAGYGQETGYMGDDELPEAARLDRDQDQMGDNSASRDTEGVSQPPSMPEDHVPSDQMYTEELGVPGATTVQPEELQTVAGGQEISLETSDLQAAVEDPPALTDDNLALVAMDNVPTASGGDLRDSQVGVEDVSAQSVLGLKDEPRTGSGHPAATSNEAIENLSMEAQPPGGALDLHSETTLEKKPLTGDDVYMANMEEVPELSFNDFMHTPVDSPRIEEDIFDVTENPVSPMHEIGQTEAAPVDIIEASVRDLPLPPAPQRSPTPEPHLPIDRQDPALAIEPAVLHERGYDRQEHPDHVAETTHEAHEAHRQAFVEATGGINEEPNDASTNNVFTALETPSAEVVNRMLGMGEDNELDSEPQVGLSTPETTEGPAASTTSQNADDAEELESSAANSDDDDDSEHQKEPAEAEDSYGLDPNRSLVAQLMDRTSPQTRTPNVVTASRETSAEPQELQLVQPKIDEMFGVAENTEDEPGRPERSSSESAEAAPADQTTERESQLVQPKIRAIFGTVEEDHVENDSQEGSSADAVAEAPVPESTENETKQPTDDEAVSRVQPKIDEMFGTAEEGVASDHHQEGSTSAAVEEAPAPESEPTETVVEQPSRGDMKAETSPTDDTESREKDDGEQEIVIEEDEGVSMPLVEDFEQGDDEDSTTAQAAPAETSAQDDDTFVIQPRSPAIPIGESGPASVVHVPTPDRRSTPVEPPQTPPARPRNLDLRTPELTHHHHGAPISTALRSTLHESERNLSHTESPASHTRSQCHYHKMRFDRGVRSHTMLIPGCSLGSLSQRAEVDAEDLGRASGEEMRRKQSLLFGENFLGHMKSEQEGQLPGDLEHRLSVLVGRELIREGHIYILPIKEGEPHIHADEEEEDGGIASRTRRRTSQTPGPSGGVGPVTPAKEGERKRKHRGSSVGRKPKPESVGKKRTSELRDVKEDEEEVEADEQDRASKKRIVEVDGTPKAVDKGKGREVDDEDLDEVRPAERDRDDEDGDMMDIDERVEKAEERPVVPARKGWFSWVWGGK